MGYRKVSESDSFRVVFCGYWSLCERKKGLFVVWFAPLLVSVPPFPLVGRACSRSAALGAVLLAFLFLRCLELAVSFSSFVSSLPVVGPVSVPSVRAAAESVVRRLFALPGARASAPVGVVSVVRGADRVSVVCGDGRTRVCRVSTASRALGKPVSVDAVFAKLSARVGQSVVFFAVEGWSPDSWFVGCVGTELLGKE